MYSVIISPSANLDLFNILRYMAEELCNSQAASNLADGIEKCYSDLAAFPLAYGFCDDPLLRQLGYRKYLVGNYLVLFRVVEGVNEVRVVHIFHETQDYIGIQKSEL